MPKLTVKPNPETLRECEILFQNGGGRAQVRNVDGTVAYGCERLSEAERYAYDAQLVYFRAKRRGERVYEWRLVTGRTPKGY